MDIRKVEKGVTFRHSGDSFVVNKIDCQDWQSPSEQINTDASKGGLQVGNEHLALLTHST